MKTVGLFLTLQPSADTKLVTPWTWYCPFTSQWSGPPESPCATEGPSETGGTGVGDGGRGRRGRRGRTWQPERMPSPPAQTMVVLTVELQ